MRLDFNKIFTAFLLGLVTFLSHLTIYACYLVVIIPKGSCSYGSPELQLGLLFINILVILVLLRARQLERNFLERWKDNWFVVLFLFIACASMFWSVHFSATIYRVLLLIFSTFIASYCAMIFSIKGFINFIAIATSSFAILSLLLIMIFPEVGIMDNPPYAGLWRGVFWHKIYLGATMALGYIAHLVILFSSPQTYGRPQKTLSFLMLILGLFLAVKSDSASGLVVFAIQTILFFLILVWLKWGHLISRRAYTVASGIGFLAIVYIIFNLDFIFGLFNRSANMTGRVPMWMHLLENYIFKRPLLGYGFGAFWLQEEIGQTIQQVVGWGYPVKVADNGYLDIFLDRKSVV